MKGSYAKCSVGKTPTLAKKVDAKETAELFARMSPTAQEKIIDLIKSLLSMK